jgi:hypothetical protein
MFLFEIMKKPQLVRAIKALDIFLLDKTNAMLGKG